MFRTTLSLALLLALGGRDLVAAQQHAIPGSQFLMEPVNAAAAAAPAWHMDAHSCAPGDATIDGGSKPNPGVPADHCNIFKLNHGCPGQPKSTGPNTEATPFPTYFTVRACPDRSWRIAYDVYFPKDTGHRNDWEWAIIKFVDDGTNSDHFVRDGIWMEQDGKHPYYKWAELDSTYSNSSDINSDGLKGLDHTKLYFGKFHHPVFPSIQNKWFPITCPPASKLDYRDNNYRYESAQNLTAGHVINKSWDYGSADSTPPTFEDGGKYDMCKFT